MSPLKDWREWRGRAFTAIAIALACTVSFAVVAAVPVPATVNGVHVELCSGTTVAAAVGFQPRAGDLVDVDGNLLEAGAGVSGSYLLNGSWCRPDTPVRPGDIVGAQHGDDIIETVVVEEQVIHQELNVQGAGPFVAVRNGGNPGKTWVRRGVITGRIFGETDIATAKPMHACRLQYQPTGKKVVLSLDDGPTSRYTGQILDVLREEGVHAVFFVLGANAEARPELVRRIVAEGHELANHGYSHTITSDSPEQVVVEEIRNTTLLLKDLTGQVTRWFRPPGGALSTSILKAAQVADHDVVLWNVDSQDWRAARGRRGAEAIAEEVLDPLPEPGSVILMHDGGGDRRATVEALTTIIRHLKAENYEFCTLNQLAEAAGLGN